MVDYKEKFIAFIDILGFRNLVEASEAGTGLQLNELLKILELFGSPKEQEERNLDFRLIQISDCAIISSEISPAGAIKLVSHCWDVVLKFLYRGIMCRGYITRGRIYHTPIQVLGTGYLKAYDAQPRVSVFKREEGEKGLPFVEVDRAVCNYIRECEDAPVKEMFSRLTMGDGDGVAIFPFKRLSHSFAVGGLDPEKEKQYNQNWRDCLNSYKKQVMIYIDSSNPSAVSKAKHYINALNAQLAVCDKTDQTIDRLCSPCSGKRPAC